MSNSTIENSSAKLNKISLIMVLINVLTFLFSLSAVVFYSMNTEFLAFVWILLSPILLLTGLLTGTIALFKKQGKSGFILNLIILIFSSPIYFFVFTPCCALPPEKPSVVETN